MLIYTLDYRCIECAVIVVAVAIVTDAVVHYIIVIKIRTLEAIIIVIVTTIGSVVNHVFLTRDIVIIIIVTAIECVVIHT